MEEAVTMEMMIILDMLRCFFFSPTCRLQRDIHKQNNVWLILNICLVDCRQTCRHESVKIKTRLGVLLLSKTQ